MRKLKLLSYILLLLLSSSVFALPQIEVLGPVPAITGNLLTGTPYVFTYAIVNNTNHGWPLNLYGFSGPLTRVAASFDDCGSSIPGGPNGICLFAIMVNATSADISNGIHQTLYLDYKGRVPTTVNISLGVVIAPSPIAVAVGTDLTANQALIINSVDGGNTFTTQNTSTFGTSSLTFAGCSSLLGSDAACIAGGTTGGGATPLALYSVNGGVTFNAANITGVTDAFTLSSGSCSGITSSAVCALVGTDTTLGFPFIVTSSNGGNTFAVPQTLPTFTAGAFNSVSCTGSAGAGTGICIAAGQNTGGSPLLISSTNGGNVFTTITYPNADTGNFNSASCTGSGSTGVCLAVGEDTSTLAPILFVSIDGGNNFILSDYIGFTDVGAFNAASCTGSGSLDVCVAGGMNSTTGAPIIATSTDGGHTFLVPSSSGITTLGSINAVSCAGGNTLAFCALVGVDNTAGSPLLITSVDGGNTFQGVTIGGVTGVAGSFNAASCAGSSGSGMCTVVGQLGTGGSSTPLLVTSLDGGNTWNVITVANVTNGYFSGAGSSNVNSLAKKHFHSANSVLQELLTNKDKVNQE